MRWLVVSCAVLSACVTPPSPKPVEVPQSKSEAATADASGKVQRELQRTIEGFIAATESREFAAVHALLSKSLRERYTAAALARDFEAEPYARDRLALIKSKMGAPIAVQGESASLEWAPGRSLRLIREAAEPSTWKIASLE